MNYEGEIRDINLVERLIELWREQFTGAIRFENDGIIKIVYFKGGDILSASTNDRADSVDEILMRAGKVSKEHVKQALSKRKENETLGDALLNLGFITRKELTWARRIQVINVVRSIEEWKAGSFTVVADYLPKREEGTIFPLPQLLVEMIVTDQDRGKFERSLESGAVVFTKAPGHEEMFRKLGLNEDAEAVMAQVDGERQATEVAAASRQETFNAFKLLHALSILGILQKRSAPAAALGFASAGVADAADVWGGGSSGTQFELGDAAAAPPPSFSMSDDDIAPVPGLADPSFDAPAPMALSSWDASAPNDAPPPSSSFHMEPELPAAAPGDTLSWGFDEAQAETAHKVTSAQSVATPPVMPPVFNAPPPAAKPRASFGEGTMSRRGTGDTTTRRAVTPMKKKAPRYGLVVALMVIFVLAAVGYFGYVWWMGREAAVPQPVQPVARTTTAPAENAAPLVPPPTQTLAPATASEAPATGTTAPAVTAATAGGTARAPRVAPAGDRAGFDAMARDFAANPAGTFTVQFAIVCDPSNVTKALRTSGDVWFAPISLKERPCFRMFWGRYATRAEAEAAMVRLPGELRESRPAVVGIPR